MLKRQNYSSKSYHIRILFLMICLSYHGASVATGKMFTGDVGDRPADAALFIQESDVDVALIFQCVLPIHRKYRWRCHDLSSLEARIIGRVVHSLVI